MHVRVFRLLLRAYPAAFVASYGTEMIELFERRLQRARARRGWWGVAVHWRRTLTDVLRTAAAERFRRGPTSGPGGPGATDRNGGGDAGMETILQDIRYAVRRLVRTPVFTTAAIAILAVGIGANAAVFGLVDALVLRPPPFERPEEVVNIYQDSDDGEPSSTSFPAYRDMTAHTDVFATVAATGGAFVPMIWEAPNGPVELSVEYATASLMSVYGLTPSRGRWFSPEHDVVGSEMVAVVSHRSWQKLMGADPAVVGSTLRVNGQPVTVIGVGPESYNGPGGALVTDVWLSISSTPVSGPFRVANLDRRQDHWYQVQARLARGVSVAQAQASMDRLALRLGEEFPELNRGRGITVFGAGEVRFHPDADAGIRQAGTALLAVVGLVLLLACSNLANLLLVRGVSRSSETAVRQALGAGGSRVARLFLIESSLLSLVGGGAGLALAAWLMRFVPLLPLPTPSGTDLDVGLDHRVLAFGLAVSLVTGVLFGLAPALRAMKTDVAGTLREERRAGAAGRSIKLLRNGLVALQVAASVVLVVGAGLFARSLSNASSVDAGVDAERVALLGTNLTQGGVGSGEVAVVTQQLVERIERLPGVARVGIVTRLPAQPGGTTTTVVEDYEPPTGTGSVELAAAAASAGYFAAAGIELLEGRMFTPADRPETPTVVLVNETMANRFWGGDAVGRRIRPQGAPGAWREVVGVVSDVKVTSLQEPPTPMFYVSAGQSNPPGYTVVARTDGDPAALLEPMRIEMQAVRPSLPVNRLATLESHLGASLRGARVTAALIGSFSVLALLLASLGIYAVVSFTVAGRIAEMGIRVALGAASRSLVAMVVADSLATVAVGIAAGLLLAGLAAPSLEGVLFEVRAVDPTSFGGAAFLLAGVAALASWLPARRAARADPVEALRAQ